MSKTSASHPDSLHEVGAIGLQQLRLVWHDAILQHMRHCRLKLQAQAAQCMQSPLGGHPGALTHRVENSSTLSDTAVLGIHSNMPFPASVCSPARMLMVNASGVWLRDGNAHVVQAKPRRLETSEGPPWL